MALKLAEMESFLKRRQIEEDRLQTEIQDAFSELNRWFTQTHCTQFPCELYHYCLRIARLKVKFNCSR